MTRFTEEQYQALQEQAVEILNQMTEEKSTREILAGIYVTSLDDKTMMQGRLMADAILQGINKFDADYKEARRDLDRFIENFQDEADAGKSCVERCNYWLKMSAALSMAAASMEEENTDRNKILREIEDLEVAEEEATTKREAELRRLAMEAIKNSGIMFCTLPELAEALEQMQAEENAEDAAEILMDLGDKELEFRAVAAMLAYTKIKNGEFENIPIEMTAVQTAAVVCAQMEQTRMMDAVGKGSLSAEAATILLDILGVVVIVETAVAAVFLGIGFAASCFGIILAIPACIMVVAGVYRAMDMAVDAWMAATDKFVKKAAVLAKDFAYGVRRTLSFVRENVIPVITEQAKAILEQVKQQVEKIRVKVNERVMVCE